MAERMDVMVARKNGDKTFWMKIGVAFKGEKGWRLTFDALPVADDKGQTTAFLFPPRDQGDRRPTAPDLDDDVPF